MAKAGGYAIIFKDLSNDYKGFRLAFMAFELFKRISWWTTQNKATSLKIKAPTVSVANEHPISHLTKFTQLYWLMGALV